MSKDNSTNAKVDQFIGRSTKWKEEYELLRKIALSCELQEELKWGVPCYTTLNKNVVLIHGFKEYCAYLFPKGALLKDEQKVLIQQTENVQAARQIRFNSIEDIVEIENFLVHYIQEAIAVEKSGEKVEMKKSTEYAVPEELHDKFLAMPELKTAFEALTPGRQRAYLLYFSQAKQSKTRASRIEKYEQQILDGKGLKD